MSVSSPAGGRKGMNCVRLHLQDKKPAATVEPSTQKKQEDTKVGYLWYMYQGVRADVFFVAALILI